MINLKDKIESEGMILGKNDLILRYEELSNEWGIDFYVYNKKGAEIDTGLLMYPGYDEFIKKNGEYAKYCVLPKKYEGFQFSYSQLFDYVNDILIENEFDSMACEIDIDMAKEIQEQVETIDRAKSKLQIALQIAKKRIGR